MNYIKAKYTIPGRSYTYVADECKKLAGQLKEFEESEE